jgi:RNA-directed DNA polymerase
MKPTENISNTTQWNAINWQEVEGYVFKLQVKIYEATKEGRLQAVKDLQKTLIKSWRGRLLAVRKVTQDNRGKRTAGIDGKSKLSNAERITLAENLKPNGKAKPAKRIYIPKANGKLRPLGIPTMEDRAKQALLKLALEPEWEAKFEPNSYGFRPARSCHDAMKAVYQAVKDGNKYILDADITGCFDNINQEKLLEKIKGLKQVRQQTRAWLKAGVIDWNSHEFQEINKGTPQGGVISPLLANIALHGMETEIKELLYANGYRTYYWNNTRGKLDVNSKKNCLEALGIIRYADDFIVTNESKEVIEQAKILIEQWLAERGLELNQEKTKIVNIKDGFNFLGFKVRKYEVGKHRADKDRKHQYTGETIFIEPSKDSYRKHYRKLAEIIDKHKASNVKDLIKELTPVIRGWCNYYQYCSGSRVFKRMEHLLFLRLKRWATRRHSNKGVEWCIRKYFMNHNKTEKWRFGEGSVHLKQHNEYPSQVKFTKVKGDKSPYNGDLKYWNNRIEKYGNLTTRQQYLFRKQKGKCTICQQDFNIFDLLEVDHIIPKCLSGKDEFENLQLIHHHCHDMKTANDLNSYRLIKNESKKHDIHRPNEWIVVNNQSIVEEHQSVHTGAV